MWDASPFAAGITVPEAPTVVHPPAVSSSRKVLAGAKLGEPSYKEEQQHVRLCDVVASFCDLTFPRDPQVSLCKKPLHMCIRIQQEAAEFAYLWVIPSGAVHGHGVVAFSELQRAFWQTCRHLKRMHLTTDAATALQSC